MIKVSPNANATIDDKCNLFANGCVTASEDINEGKVSEIDAIITNLCDRDREWSIFFRVSLQVRVIIKLNGLELQRIDRDVCDGVLKSNIPQLRNVIQLFGLPDSCPIKAGQVCATEDQKISLNRYKDFLALANGKVEILIKVLHGKAGKSCIRVDLEIFR